VPRTITERGLFSTKRSNTLPSVVASSKESVSKAWSVTKGEQEDHLNRAGLLNFNSELEFLRTMVARQDSIHMRLNRIEALLKRLCETLEVEADKHFYYDQKHYERTFSVVPAMND
jgi:hypothetical protein